MQISKQRLIQIIKEELNIQEPTNVTEDEELEVNEEEKDMSRHAYELYKNMKKGYSPQAAVTATPEHDEGEKRLHKMGVGPYSDKPKRGKRGCDESELASRESLEEMIKKELMEMIKK
jgi:hypothetical protein